jgi:hypothetical protein
LFVALSEVARWHGLVGMKNGAIIGLFNLHRIPHMLFWKNPKTLSFICIIADLDNRKTWIRMANRQIVPTCIMHQIACMPVS